MPFATRWYQKDHPLLIIVLKFPLMDRSIFESVLAIPIEGPLNKLASEALAIFENIPAISMGLVLKEHAFIHTTFHGDALAIAMS